MVLVSDLEPTGNLSEWFADVCETRADALAAGKGRCLIGGAVSCPKEPGDPPICPREWARMDLFFVGQRRTIRSRAGRRVDVTCVPGDVNYWAPDAWAGEANEWVQYVGVVFRKAYLRCIVVKMTPSGAPPQCVYHSGSPLGGAAEGVKRALDMLAAEREGQPKSERYLCSALLHLASRHLREEEAAPHGAEATWVRLHDFLVDFAQTALTRDDVAAALELSPGYISELCRSQAGETFLQVLERIRLEQACRLLRLDQELTVAEIAYRCGYKDPSYFGRVFRRQMGCTPGVFRRG